MENIKKEIKTRNRSKSPKKRADILKASIEEFYNKGYEASNMDEIANAANVSKATIYNHFENKEELFLYIIHDMISLVSERLSYKYDKKKRIRAQILEIINAEIEYMSNQENIKKLKIITGILLLNNSEISKKVMTIKPDVYSFLIPFFKDAYDDGKVHSSDSEFLSKVLLGSIHSFCFLPQIFGEDVADIEVKEKVKEHILAMFENIYFK